MDIGFFGLLYLNENIKTENANLKGMGAIYLYIKNAYLLSESLRNNGYKFTLVTNQYHLLNDLVIGYGYELNIKQIDFVSEVPNGTRFYGAHFKKDVFEYFSKLKNTYSILLDLDVVCINEMPLIALRCVGEGVPMLYDITEQLSEAYGQNIINNDVSMILGRKEEGVKWFGGEFIGGDDIFFRKLYGYIESIYSRYLASIQDLNHIGDECYTSSSLHYLIKDENLVWFDVSSFVNRYWNDNVQHKQKNLNINVSFLHLPSDKVFLCEYVEAGNDIKYFAESYYRYIMSFKNQVRLSIKKISKKMLLHRIRKLL